MVQVKAECIPGRLKADHSKWLFWLWATAITVTHMTGLVPPVAIYSKQNVCVSTHACLAQHILVQVSSNANRSLIV